MLGEVLGRSERSHEALEPHRSLKDARLVAAAKAAPTPVMSNSTGRASASRLALACYCCDRVLAAEARFHDPPLPGLLVADQLRRPPRSFVPVSAHGQGSLRYLPPSKRQSAPAPAKRAVLDCRAEGTCGHERSLAFGGDAVARCLTFTGRYGDWRDERDREGHFHLIRACFIEATATFASL
jgi:hypothetical protein